jgi:YcxB-like protein
MLEEHTLELDGIGVRGTCSHIVALIPWSAIERVDETSEFYLFWYGPSLALPVPKRILTDDDDSALRGFARTHAQDRGPGLAHEHRVPAGAAV